MRYRCLLLRSADWRRAGWNRCATLACVVGLAACGHVGIDLNGKPSADAATSASAAASGGSTGGPSSGMPSSSSKPPKPGASAGTLDGSVAFDASLMKDSGSSVMDASGDGGSFLDGSQGDGSSLPDGSFDAGMPSRDGSSAANSDAGRDGGGALVCEENQTCSIVCVSSPCEATCAKSSDCTVVAGNVGKVAVACAKGAACHLEVGSSPDAELICTGEGTCYGYCTEGDSCKLLCVDPQKCVLDCGRTADCKLDCGDEAACYLVHDNLGAEVALNCPGDDSQQHSCSESLITCNTECP